MSILIVDQIQRPITQTGFELQIKGDVIVNGTINGNVGPYTGNTSNNCINNLYVENLNDCGSGINFNGELNVNGDFTGTTFYGDSSNLTNSINHIVPNGNSFTGTSFLQYGVNVISTATTQDFCVRLPQTPIQGREVNVINNSGFDIYVYPSVEGGSINGVTNGSSIVPADGKLYNFFCYENPSPGSWAGNYVQAAAGIFDSGIISIDTTNAPVNAWDYAYVSAFDDNFKNVASSFASYSISYSLTLPNVIYEPNPASCNSFSAFCQMVYFKPPTPWNYIDKVRVYTNFSTGTTEGGLFGLVYGQEQPYYSAGTTLWLNADNVGSGTLGTPYADGAYQMLMGTANATNGFTATPGEPGTWFGELVYSATTRPTMIGQFLLSSGTMNTGIPYGVANVDYYHIKYIAFAFQTKRYSPDVKFRFEIEYS